MDIKNENRGGSFSVANKSLSNYIKKYKQLRNHVKLCEFARSLIKGKDVIEFRYGNGAGSLVLSGKYRGYLELEMDIAAIKHAKTTIENHYKNTKLRTLDEFKCDESSGKDGVTRIIL